VVLGLVTVLAFSISLLGVVLGFWFFFFFFFFVLLEDGVTVIVLTVLEFIVEAGEMVDCVRFVWIVIRIGFAVEEYIDGSGVEVGPAVDVGEYVADKIVTDGVG
jgi:hypothetical protein